MRLTTPTVSLNQTNVVWTVDFHVVHDVSRFSLAFLIFFSPSSSSSYFSSDFVAMKFHVTPTTATVVVNVCARGRDRNANNTRIRTHKCTRMHGNKIKTSKRQTKNEEKKKMSQGVTKVTKVHVRIRESMYIYVCVCLCAQEEYTKTAVDRI